MKMEESRSRDMGPRHVQQQGHLSTEGMAGNMKTRNNMMREEEKDMRIRDKGKSYMTMFEIAAEFELTPVTTRTDYKLQ